MKHLVELIRSRNFRFVFACSAFFISAYTSSAPVQAENSPVSGDVPSSQTRPLHLRVNAPPDEGFKSLTVADYFSCDIPLEWQHVNYSLGLSAEEKKVHGVTLEGPWRGEIPVRISIYYYAEHNLLYKSADHYVRLFSSSVSRGGTGGGRYGQVARATVSGREGRVFERIKNEFRPIENKLPPPGRPSVNDPKVYDRREMMAKPVPVRERFVVLAAKSGFYALRYSAHAETFQEFLPVFQRVTSSFSAKL